MPETRYHRTEHYKSDAEGGGLASVKEVPYEVSDEQLYQEQLAKEMNEVHEKAIAALKNWDKLSPAQKDTLLKGLIKWALWKDGWLKLGILG